MSKTPPADHLTVGELRLAVQQAFFGLAALRPATDTGHRAVVRKLIRKFVASLELTVIGAQGEILTGRDVDELAAGAIDEVIAFSTEPPPEELLV